MDDNSIHISGLSTTTVAIIGIMIASAGLLTYHFIMVLWWRRRQHTISLTHQEVVMLPQQRTTLTNNFEGQRPSSLEDSNIAAFIPTCNYTIDVALVSKSEDVTCSICLSEFKNGEAVRVLPECLHTFHVPCIDMWLCSHSNCPLCRTDTGVFTPVLLLDHSLSLQGLDEAQTAS